ncbi:MAG: TBC domain-containing protein [archaeon]|nr:TBC domain-containing protein [archaeon]
MEEFDQDIIQQVVSFLSNYSSNNKKLSEDFEKFISDIDKEREELEKKKTTYFETSKDFYEMQEKLTKGIETLKEEDISALNANLRKIKPKVDEHSKTYKEGVDNLNKYFEECESKYKGLIGQFHLNELNKIKFFTENSTKVKDKFLILSVESKMIAEKVNESLKKVNQTRDIKLLSNRFDFFNNEKKRFSKEVFLNYDFVYRKKQEESKVADKGKNDAIGGNNETSIQALIKQIMEKEDAIYCNVDINYKIQRGEEITINGYDKYEVMADKIIHDYQPLTEAEFNKLTDQLEKKKNINYFIGSLFYYFNTNLYVEINCLENLKYLSQLLITCIKNNKDCFNLNFLILFIAEKSIYVNPENIFNKCYLCNLLSDNAIFKDKEFWSQLIERRIAWVLDRETKAEIIRRDTLNQLETSNVLVKVKSIFSNWKMKENKLIENEILYNQISQEKLSSVSVKILEDYICHFSNFKFAIGDALEIIIRMSLKFKFDREYVNLFNSMLNTTSFSIKTKKAMIENIEKKVDYQKTFNSAFISGETLQFTKAEKEKESSKSMLLIANALQFTSQNDMLNILRLNKNYCERLKKYVCKNYLFKKGEITLKDRLSVWKLLLNYNNTIKDCNYKEVLKEIEPGQSINLQEARDIIALDVARTPFESNLDENRIKILNILRALSLKNPNTKYCQGMNYIAAFILQIVNDEEEAFYIYLSLLRSTEYGELFVDELSKLKNYFYVIDRLLNTLLPELSSAMKQNNITVSYFASPWLITLFTNTYQYIKGDNPKVLLRIWDFFLLDGWNSIIQICISLIKHFEGKLLKLPFEELLQFLINDMIKSQFFQNENCDTLMFINANLKIEKKLLKSILNEYDIRKKLNMKLSQ